MNTNENENTSPPSLDLSRFSSGGSNAVDCGLGKTDMNASTQGFPSALDVSKWPTNTINAAVEPVSMQSCQKFAVVLRNVLTPVECNALIEHTNSQGYEAALLNVGRGRQVMASDVRKSERCIVDSIPLAQLLWDRIKHAVQEDDVFKPVGLNERMRFLRYREGDFFAPHTDGSYHRRDGSSHSRVTLMLYLNGRFQGGETNLLNEYDGSCDNAIVPEPGKVSLFRHDVYHEGAMLKGGIKYAMRSDVMFESKPEGSNSGTRIWGR